MDLPFVGQRHHILLTYISRTVMKIVVYKNSALFHQLLDGRMNRSVAGILINVESSAHRITDNHCYKFQIVLRKDKLRIQILIRNMQHHVDKRNLTDLLVALLCHADKG